MPVETRIQVRQGTTSAWNTASTATITNAVASTAPRTVTAAARTAGSNEVTITAAGATAAYAVGSSITIYGTGDATVNGTWTVTGNASTNQVKFASTATTALALTGLTGSVYATTATVGVITYTASNSFNVGDKVSVFGINPTNFDVTNATILSASSTAFTVAGSVSGDPIPTYTSGGFARSVVLASGELGLDTTTGRISVGDGTTYWGDAKQLAWSNASQTLTGNQTLYPAAGLGLTLHVRGKGTRTYTLYKGASSGGTFNVNTYYSTTLMPDIAVSELITVTGFSNGVLNVSGYSINSVSSDKLSFTVTTPPAGTALTEVHAATATITESTSYQKLLQVSNKSNEVFGVSRDGTAYVSAGLRSGGYVFADTFTTVDPTGYVSFFTGATVQLYTAATGYTQPTDTPSIESQADSTSARYHVAFSNPNGSVGRISTTGSATAYTTSSDYRLKENVSPITGASERVLALNPVQFSWIGSEGPLLDGFLAHEVQSVVPEAIDGEKDAVAPNGAPIYQGIDQSKLVPLLTAALQDALLRIEALEAKVN